MIVLASASPIVSLPTSALTIVLIALAAILGGVARYFGGKAKLPDWASLTVALFVFGLFLAIFGVI